MMAARAFDSCLSTRPLVRAISVNNISELRMAMRVVRTSVVGYCMSTLTPPSVRQIPHGEPDPAFRGSMHTPMQTPINTPIHTATRYQASLPGSPLNGPANSGVIQPP